MNVHLWKLFILSANFDGLGMDEEAQRVETQLLETTLAGGVITAAHETD